MSHSLNYYSVVENDEAAATSPSPYSKTKFSELTWGLVQKSFILAKTVSSQKRKWSYYGVV